MPKESSRRVAPLHWLGDKILLDTQLAIFFFIMRATNEGNNVKATAAQLPAIYVPITAGKEKKNNDYKKAAIRLAPRASMHPAVPRGRAVCAQAFFLFCLVSLLKNEAV